MNENMKKCGNCTITNNYQTPIGLTQQFRFCGNPLRLDMYSNCQFGCEYCFAKSHNGTNMFEEQNIDTANIQEVKRLFERAFESQAKTNNVVVELLKRKTPIHIGGMSDPFQPIEFQLHLTYQVIELSNKYGAPLVFSTKQCFLPQCYYDILNPKLHAFQISLVGNTEDFLRKYEKKTPTPNQRIEFMKTLKSKGFWVSMRLQPLIDIEESLALCHRVENIVDYITVEHLKIATNNTEQMNLFRDRLKDYYKPKQSRMFELNKGKKAENILRIITEIKGCKIGIGDNDLHQLSQSKCCCGIDTIGGNFDTWLRYNYTYFLLAKPKPNELKDIYAPIGSVNSIFTSDTVFKNCNDYKSYVDYYCLNNIKSFEDNLELYNYFAEYLYNSENIKKFDKNDNPQLNLFDFNNEESE